MSAIKAWVRFVGNPVAIQDQYNVAGVVRNGTGDYTITYTTALQNVNYCTVVTPAIGLAESGVGGIGGVNAQAVRTCRVFIRALTNNLGVDLAFVNVLIMGN